MIKTKIFKETYKGTPCISIWEVDDDGLKKQRYPIISFGVNKAKLLFEHLDEIKATVEKLESGDESEFQRFKNYIELL